MPPLPCYPVLTFNPSASFVGGFVGLRVLLTEQQHLLLLAAVVTEEAGEVEMIFRSRSKLRSINDWRGVDIGNPSNLQKNHLPCVLPQLCDVLGGPHGQGSHAALRAGKAIITAQFPNVKKKQDKNPAWRIPVTTPIPPKKHPKNTVRAYQVIFFLFGRLFWTESYHTVSVCAVR